MNKLAIRETFPPGIVGREIVLAQMCHHYRRISSAKARVDTNLFKAPKACLSRPLSAEVASIVQRSLSPRSPPKHRRCLKYEQELGEYHIKPSVRSQNAESKLRATPEVYHPAVKLPKPLHHQEFDGQQQATQTSFDNSLTEDAEPKTKDEAVQTVPTGLYRPLDIRSVQFLRDITNDALQSRAFTSSALNRIFMNHQLRNSYSLSQDLMERELEELRRQLGMVPRLGRKGSGVSDGEALDALDSLVLDPRIKEQVIHSLRLSRDNDDKKMTYSYFDRLKLEDEEEEEEQPTRDRTSNKLKETLQAVESYGSTISPSTQLEGIKEEIPEKDNEKDEIPLESTDEGWDAEVEDDEKEGTTASSSKDEEDDEESSEEGEVEEDNDGDVEEVASMAHSDEEDYDEQSASRAGSTASDEEIEEVTQIESTSKPLTEESQTKDNASKFGDNPLSADYSPNKEDSDNLSTSSPDPIAPLMPILPLVLETAMMRGDKWRTSLEVVKEESDSTTGQISDISTASTPSEEEKEGISKGLASTITSKDGSSSPTYRSAASGIQEETARQTSSSTGGEIIKQMDELVADSEMISEENKKSANRNETADGLSDHPSAEKTNPQEDDEQPSETGSEVESVQTDDEEEVHSHESSDSDLESVHTD